MLNLGRSNQATDYEIDLQRIEDELARLEKIAFTEPVKSEYAARYVYRLYARSSLNGNLRELRHVEKLINRAIESEGPAEDLCLLKANLDFKLHRLAEAKRDLHLAPALLARRQGRMILADIDFEEGHYAAARAALETLAAEEATWDVLARIAHIEGKMGDVEKADELYFQAEDEITAKEMRSFAWVELQRGLLDLSHGCANEAIVHYNCAERAYSGNWLTAEYLGDAYAAMGLLPAAAAFYQSALEKVEKPELLQKLNLFSPCLAGYLESSGLGEVHYYHHLAEYYSDVQTNGDEAVKWARKDIALRNNFNTQTALAWALHKAGQTIAALPYIETALSSGVRDANIFFKAAAIFAAARQSAKAHNYEHRAIRLNPLCALSHIH